ncbi:nucleotidyltransferase domain-containing protein [Leptolyngbyaceae cyanobacterium UHCC 1019]
MPGLNLSIADIQAAIPQILEQIPYLKLLVLFGSRARGDHFPSSDWDFALLFDEELRQQYEPGKGWNCYRSWGVIQQTLGLGDDEMDWIDLKDASELLAHAIARDGLAIYEREPGLFEKFRQEHLKSDAKMKQIRKDLRELVRSKLKVRGL